MRETGILIHPVAMLTFLSEFLADFTLSYDSFLSDGGREGNDLGEKEVFKRSVCSNP